MSDYILIESDVELRKAVSEWRKSKEIAVDIECENNLHHYGTKISIIQVSDIRKNWIIDMLAVSDYDVIKDIFEDNSIVKIFHDVSFDFRILDEFLKCKPKNVFDTSVAAQFLGLKQIGLGALLEENFKIKKEKEFQKADWLKRPMSKEMLSYASIDSKYLIRLKHKLERNLIKKRRLHWVQEEFKFLEQKDYKQEIPTYNDIKGAGKLNEYELSVLKAIFAEREKIAKKLDKPVYFVISNKLLLSLAQNPPKSIGDWQKLKGVHPVVKKSAKNFYYSAQKAKNKPVKRKNGKKRAKRLTSAQERRFDELDAFRRKIAKKLNIESFHILDKDEMIKLATGGSILELKPWQQKILTVEGSQDKYSR